MEAILPCDFPLFNLKQFSAATRSRRTISPTSPAGRILTGSDRRSVLQKRAQLELSNSLETEFCLDALEMVLTGGRKPKIFHSDRG